MDSEEIKGFVASLDTSIDQLKQALEPVMKTSLEDKIAQCKLPKDQIKVYNSHLYCVISILYCYIKVLGIKTEDHPVMAELTRIQLVMKAAKNIEESLKKNDENNAKSQQEAKEFLQRTLGTKVGAAVPESMKSPAISSVNFQGTHTKFSDLESKPDQAKPAKGSKTTKKQQPSGKVSKPKKGKKH